MQRSPGRATTWRPTTRRRSLRFGRTSPTFPQTSGFHRPCTSRRRRCGCWTTRSCPPRRRAGYDVRDVIDGLIDAESFFEIKPLFAPSWSPASACSRGAPSASWPTTPPSSAACSLSTLPTRPPGSSGSATPSASR
ncbi:MAG: carboxyl transferase domain-containing protein [Microthrixaceae bacterium]